MLKNSHQYRWAATSDQERISVTTPETSHDTKEILSYAEVG